GWRVEREGWSEPLFQSFAQSGEHSADALGLGENGRRLDLIEQADALTQHQVGFQLHERTPRDAQVAEELLGVLPALAFRYVRRDRCCRAANLTGHSEQFLLRKVLGHPVTFLRQRHAQLPNFQFPVTLNAHPLLLSLVFHPPPSTHHPPPPGECWPA